MVTPDRQVALDEHVRPDPAALLDTNFRFSGIEKEQLKNAKYDLIGVQQALGKIIGPETVLLGHGMSILLKFQSRGLTLFLVVAGIENDLRALRLLHPMGSIVDTSIVSP